VQCGFIWRVVRDITTVPGHVRSPCCSCQVLVFTCCPVDSASRVTGYFFFTFHNTDYYRLRLRHSKFFSFWTCVCDENAVPVPRYTYGRRPLLGRCFESWYYHADDTPDATAQTAKRKTCAVTRQTAHYHTAKGKTCVSDRRSVQCGFIWRVVRDITTVPGHVRSPCCSCQVLVFTCCPVDSASRVTGYFFFTFHNTDYYRLRLRHSKFFSFWTCVCDENAVLTGTAVDVWPPPASRQML
jgi:hypothetical protein